MLVRFYFILLLSVFDSFFYGFIHHSTLGLACNTLIVSCYYYIFLTTWFVPIVIQTGHKVLPPTGDGISNVIKRIYRKSRIYPNVLFFLFSGFFATAHWMVISSSQKVKKQIFNENKQIIIVQFIFVCASICKLQNTPTQNSPNCAVELAPNWTQCSNLFINKFKIDEILILYGTRNLYFQLCTMHRV